jgi:hypothetical protein
MIHIFVKQCDSSLKAIKNIYAIFSEISMQLFRKAFYRAFQRYNKRQHHTKPSDHIFAYVAFQAPPDGLSDV